MNNIGVLDSQIQGHTARGSKSIAANLGPGDPAQQVPVIDQNDSQQRDDTGAQGVAHKHHIVMSTVVKPEALQSLAFLVKQPNGGLQEAVVDVAAVEHLHSELVVEQQLVVALLDQIEPADGEDDVAVLVVQVDEVGRGSAEGLLVAHALHHALGGAEIGLVDGQDQAAEAGDGVELVGGGQGPAVGVVRAHVGAAPPEPARAAQHHHALGAAEDRH